VEKVRPVNSGEIYKWRSSRVEQICNKGKSGKYHESSLGVWNEFGRVRGGIGSCHVISKQELEWNKE